MTPEPKTHDLSSPDLGFRMGSRFLKLLPFPPSNSAGTVSAGTVHFSTHLHLTWELPAGLAPGAGRDQLGKWDLWGPLLLTSILLPFAQPFQVSAYGKGLSWRKGFAPLCPLWLILSFLVSRMGSPHDPYWKGRKTCVQNSCGWLRSRRGRQGWLNQEF